MKTHLLFVFSDFIWLKTYVFLKILCHVTGHWLAENNVTGTYLLNQIPNRHTYVRNAQIWYLFTKKPRSINDFKQTCADIWGFFLVFFGVGQGMEGSQAGLQVEASQGITTLKHCRDGEKEKQQQGYISLGN